MDYQTSYYADWKARNAARFVQYQSEYYRLNRSQRIAASTERNRQNRDAANASIKRWKKRNPEKVAEYEARRRARKLQNSWEPIDPQRVFDRDGGICHLCRTAVEVAPSLDHLVPLSLGGSHTYDNVALAHTLCNVRRGVRELV